VLTRAALAVALFHRLRDRDFRCRLRKVHRASDTLNQQLAMLFDQEI
jgi:hypothetical protein